MSARQNGRRYTSADVAEARRLYDDGDSWTPWQIWSLFRRRGISVSHGTVRGWVVPGEAERIRERNRVAAAEARAAATDGRVGGRAPTGAWKWARAQALHRTAGLSGPSIAALFRFDYGDAIEPSALAAALQRGTPPRVWREEATAA